MAKKRKVKISREKKSEMSDEERMAFEDFSKAMGVKTTSEFKVIEIDMDIQEVCLYDKHGNPVIVDLRDQYVIKAQKWQPGCIIKATIGPAQSRFTPFLVWIFEGDIEVSLPK